MNLKYKPGSRSNSSGGRNHSGHITCFHRGGGHKQRSRWVNFQYLKDDSAKGSASNVSTSSWNSIYDPLRSGLVGYQVNSTSKVEPAKLGLTLLSNSDTNLVGIKLGDVAPHTNIFNIEMVAGKGGQLVRSAGCSASVVNHVGGYTRVRLPSGEQRLIPSECKCSVGIVGGTSAKDKSLKLHRAGKGKAGRSRWLGIRPTVRGTARNPVDHPHGGGQGKTSGGRPAVTPWSIPEGVRTSALRGASFIVVSRH